MASPTLVSIVAPAYRTAGCIPELHRRIQEAFAPLPETEFELILVNDHSPDPDWERIQELALADRRVKGLDLSRNFGQHHAITAGVDHASGDWVVVMDCDLQDRPEEIPRLLCRAREGGYDAVFAQRVQRQDGWIKVALSRGFHLLFNRLSSVPIDPTISNFSIASHQVICAYRSLRESSRAYNLAILWCGFRVGYLPVEHGARFSGTSAYTLRRSLRLAFDSITSLSNKPLRLASQVGITMSLGAFLYGTFLVIRFLLWAIPVEGWTSLMVSLYFLAGLLLAFLGILGIYLGKVFDETKGRPIYLVKSTLNLGPDHPSRRWVHRRPARGRQS
jgi:polyisoprenyl-phosphate glycosyltransferase